MNDWDDDNDWLRDPDFLTTLGHFLAVVACVMVEQDEDGQFWQSKIDEWLAVVSRAQTLDSEQLTDVAAICVLLRKQVEQTTSEWEQILEWRSQI